MRYQCENCDNIHDKEKHIYECHECSNDCCIDCRIESKDNFYCSQHCADCND